MPNPDVPFAMSIDEAAFQGLLSSKPKRPRIKKPRVSYVYDPLIAFPGFRQLGPEDHIRARDIVATHGVSPKNPTTQEIGYVFATNHQAAQIGSEDALVLISPPVKAKDLIQRAMELSQFVKDVVMDSRGIPKSEISIWRRKINLAKRPWQAESLPIP